MPTVALPPLTPFTCQVTAVLLVLLTVAVNAWGVATCTLAVGGATVTVIGGGVTVTVADPDLVGSATDTAVTVTVAGDGTFAGAV